MEKQKQPARWLRVFSPFALAELALLFFMGYCFMDRNESHGWSMFWVLYCGPAFIVLLIADRIIKALTQNKTVTLWVVELILLVSRSNSTLYITDFNSARLRP